MIVDAGGGTIDVSAYQQRSRSIARFAAMLPSTALRLGTQPFEEISAAKCSLFPRISNKTSLTLQDRPFSWIGIRFPPCEGAYRWFVSALAYHPGDRNIFVIQHSLQTPNSCVMSTI